MVVVGGGGGGESMEDLPPRPSGTTALQHPRPQVSEQAGAASTLYGVGSLAGGVQTAHDISMLSKDGVYDVGGPACCASRSWFNLRRCLMSVHDCSCAAGSAEVHVHASPFIRHGE